MRPQEVLNWLQATPFIPFRILMTSGRTYDVRHPELVRVLRGSLILFTPSAEPAVYDRAEMIGLTIIEQIAPLEVAATS
jgi:hypothetical protein